MAIKKTAGSKTTAGKKSAPLDPKVADKLLDLLSTDNGFRRLFKKDPASALASVGYGDVATASSIAGGCYDVAHIAPKREITLARDQLKAHLTSSLAPTNPHCFEAGKVIPTLKRIKT